MHTPAAEALPSDFPGPAPDGRARLLRGAAFGPAPEAGPLPAGRDAREIWWRAVAHGGRGFYARAGADLALLADHGGAGPVWSSLAASTAGSLIRQMGGHDAAAVHDGRALVLARDAGGHAALPALCDALTGLAADRLGRGDWRGSRTLLRRCRDEAEAMGGAPPRAALRLHWVTAETAMTAGDPDAAASAVRPARGLIDSGAVDSARHGVKTLLVAGAVEAVCGRAAQSAVLAGQARRQAHEAALLPLRWAACMLLAGVAGTPARVRSWDAEQRHCAAELARRGGGGPRLMRGYG